MCHRQIAVFKLNVHWLWKLVFQSCCWNLGTSLTEILPLFPEGSVTILKDYVTTIEVSHC